MVCIVSNFDEKMRFNRSCYLKPFEFNRILTNDKIQKKNTNDNKLQFCRNFLSVFPFRLFFKLFSDESLL